MLGPIEIQHNYQQEYKRWEKKFNRQIAGCFKRNPMVRKDFIEEIIISKATRRKERIIEISDRSYSAQDYIRRNNFLADLFARATNASKKYDKLPIGNFFYTDYPQIKKEHQQKATTHPMWYAYRKNAFEYPQNELISLFAQYEVLVGISRKQISETIGKNEKLQTQPTYIQTESLDDVIRRTEGVMTRSEVAEYLKKAPSTISRLAKEGVIPSKMVNGKYMFIKSEID